MTTTTRQAIAAALTVIKELTSMSTGIKQPYAKVLPVAMRALDGMRDSCTWINLAGSLRRQCPMVSDIEIVAVPDGEKLYELLDRKLREGKIAHLPTKRWGRKYRGFIFNGFKFDIFIQPDPQTLGINFMIRTGSSEFSKHMVTKRSQGGWMPDYYQVDEARVWHDGRALDTPEEQDVFTLWRMDYVAPEQRTADYKPVLREVSLDFIIDQLPELAPAPEPKFTFADAARLTLESATWPLPTFASNEARKAIEANGFTFCAACGFAICNGRCGCRSKS